MTQPSIVALGEPLIEFNQTQPGEPSYRQGFGGDTSNFIIAAARHGARTAYITKLGDDAFGGMFMLLWQREKVDTRGVVVDTEAPTGAYVVTHTERGHVFSYLRAGSAASKIAPINLNTGLIRGARFFHVSAISQAISVNACDTVFTAIDMARDGGAAICYDPNLRLQLWPLRRAQAIIQETIGLSNYFLPSLDDARALTGLTDTDAILDRFFAEGAKTVLLKLGADGVIVADGTQRTHVPGFNVKAVDATGAGDCFAGTFVARLAAGDEVVTAARYANAAAALATTGYGAIEPIPTAEQVAALLHATPHASHA